MGSILGRGTKIPLVAWPDICVCIYVVAQTVNNLHAMQETWIQSLGQEDPLEKGMVTHSSILAWITPRTDEPFGLQSMRSQRVRHDQAVVYPV